MNATRLPGFSATASIYRGGSYYEATSKLSGSRLGEAGAVHPAMRREGCRSYNTMKGPLFCCFFDFAGFRVASCCGEQGCNTFEI